MLKFALAFCASFLATSSLAQPVDSSRYSESGFTLQTKTGSIFGTLCSPAGAHPGGRGVRAAVPIALIVAGSGPTNRDGNSAAGVSCDPYKILARRLAAQGIATVRYDKRGVAESTLAIKSEADLRFDDYISDARAWIDTLRASKKYRSISVIGHSEGSLIGMIASVDADKFISIAGAGRRVDAVLREQLKRLPDTLRDSAYAILDSLVAGHTVATPPQKLRSLFRPSVQPYLISWLRFNPQVEIRKLHVPVLLAQGTKDYQVSVPDAQLLASANPKAKLEIIDNMNHVFRTIQDGREENIRSYSDPTLPISDTLVNVITEFIKAK